MINMLTRSDVTSHQMVIRTTDLSFVVETIDSACAAIVMIDLKQNPDKQCRYQYIGSNPTKRIESQGNSSELKFVDEFVRECCPLMDLTTAEANQVKQEFERWIGRKLCP